MMRRYIFPFMILLTAGVCIGWILHVPRFAKNPNAPLPVDAQIIYSSANPDWAALKRVPVAETLAPVFPLLQTVEHAPLVLATAPVGGRDRSDTLIVVSAIGCRALFLRHQLALAPPSNVRQLRSYGAWPVWEITPPSTAPARTRIRFSITEGLLICAISDNSHDIYYLLDTLDRRRLSKSEQKEIR